MASRASGLETKMNGLFVDSTPKLPDGGKKALVEWAPILSLIAGIVSLISAWNLWHWARVVDSVAGSIINTPASFCGGRYDNPYNLNACSGPLSTPTSSIWLWLGVAFLLAEGLLYVMAYSGLKKRQKQGWNYLFYALLLNVAYAVVGLFDSYDVIGNFVGTIIASAFGFYFLFQIRGFYLGKSHQPPTAAGPKVQ